MQPKTLKTVFRFLLLASISVVLCLPAPPDATGKIYRWVDENGQLHFSDSPQNVPAEQRQEASKYKPDTSGLTIINSNSASINNSSTNEKTAGNDDPLNRDSIAIPYRAKEGYANRVIVDITFNNSVTVPILVDTGSPGLVISAEVANRLGLFASDGSRLMVLISGIGGAQTAARTIIDKISLGNISEEFIPAHIVSQMADAYQGLIGMDILSKYTLTIDPANKQLIANAIKNVQDRPGGRDKSWWLANFREFNYYSQFWEQQAELINASNSPYSRLASSEQQKLKEFILQQKSEAQELYNRLDRFARWKSVPKHWRR